MLDNLVFYYDAEKYDQVTEKLKKLAHSFKVSWELTQMKGSPVWKRCFGILLVDSWLHPVWVNNFHALGEDASLRCFKLQINWFNFANIDLNDLEVCEQREFEFFLTKFKVEELDVKRWHFELTLALGRSETIFNYIIKPLMKCGWKILHLQPDPEKILYRDKFSLWHLVHPSRKILIRGYVANAAKYPKCFENMTKCELSLPTLTDFDQNKSRRILDIAQEIRRKLVEKFPVEETRQIIWAKAILQPQIFTWFNNSNTLSLAWFFLNSSQPEITPYPNVYLSQEETMKLLEEILNSLRPADR